MYLPITISRWPSIRGCINAKRRAVSRYASIHVNRYGQLLIAQGSRRMPDAVA